MSRSGRPASRRRETLLNEDIGPLLWRLALPLGLSLLATSLFAAIDAYFLGLLGPFPLSALGFALPVLLMLNSLAMALGLGTGARTAQALGRDDEQEATLTLTSAFALGLAVALAVMALGLATLKPLFDRLGAGPETWPHLRPYMTLCYAGAPFLFLFLIGNHALRATGNTRAPAWTMIASLALNALLDPLLIFGWGPLPRLETAGAAWATLISRGLAMAIVLTLLGRREGLLRWPRIAGVALLRRWRAILAIALPALLGKWMFPAVMMILTARISAWGDLAVAGLGVALKIESLLMVVTTALAAALLPFIGQNTAAGRHRRAFSGLRTASRFCLAWGIAAWLLLLVSAPMICRLFSQEPQVVEVATSYLRIIGASLGLQGVAGLLTTAFNAIGRPMHATALTLLRMVVLYLPLALVCAELAGISGLFVGGALGNLLAGWTAWSWGRRTFGSMSAGSQPADHAHEAQEP